MFFGASISRNQSYTFTSQHLKAIFIQNISLDNKFSGKKTVYVTVETKGERYTLCALRKTFREEYKCVFLFKVRNERKKYKFSIDSEDSRAKVYLSGFVEEEEDKDKNPFDDEKGNEIDNDNGIDDVLSDNEEENIEHLLNKKRKEKPLNFKPITLKKMDIK